MRCPLVHICVYFVMGMLICDGLAGTVSLSSAQLLVPLCLFVLFYAFSCWKSLRLTAYLSMALTFVFMGWTYFSFRYDEVRRSVPVSGDSVVGCVIGQPDRKPKTWAVRLETQDGVGLLAYLRTSEPPNIGDTISFRPMLVKRTCPLDSDDVGSAGYKRYLFYSGVSAVTYSDSSSLTVIPSTALNLRNYADAVRLRLSELYREGGVVGDEGAVAEAITTGNRTLLTASLKDSYSDAGASHILALSGYHLSLIYALLELMFLSRLVAIRWRWISRLCVLSLLWVFAWLAGMPPSLMRATIMITTMIVSGLLYRNSMSLNSLAISALILLVADPLSLFNVGFQLSYVSMVGILLVGIPLTDRLTGVHWLLDKVALVIVITLTCSVFTAPLLALYFGRLPLLSAMTNLMLALIVPAVLVLAFLWWVTIFIAPLQHVVTAALLFAVSVMNGVVEFVASIPWGTFEWRPNMLGITLFYALLCSIIRIFHYLCSSKS